MIKRKADTVLRVAEPAQLMDFLIAKMGGMAKSSIKQLLGQRRVKVGNVVQTRHDFELKKGDVVTVSSGRGNSQLTHPKLKIVYEDDDLIVVNKQPGLLTVATTPGSKETTVMSILRAYVKKQNARANIYVVHRLDRETSGLLVFARSEELQHYMREYWRELVTERTYIALAEGTLEPREGKITTWLTEDKRNAVVYSSPVDDGGDIAITNYKVLRTTPTQRSSTDGHRQSDRAEPFTPQGRENGRLISSLEGRPGGVSAYSLVELHLETGRTNQIRVHLASKGCPVVGDRKYGHGNESSPIDRLCLHAKVLAFIHPVTEKTVRFESPVPKEFNRVLQ
jgi:23S rRNA pseudouridine1911/1915/1917 synthase